MRHLIAQWKLIFWKYMKNVIFCVIFNIKNISRVTINFVYFYWLIDWFPGVSRSSLVTISVDRNWERAPLVFETFRSNFIFKVNYPHILSLTSSLVSDGRKVFIAIHLCNSRGQLWQYCNNIFFHDTIVTYRLEYLVG